MKSKPSESKEIMLISLLVLIIIYGILPIDILPGLEFDDVVVMIFGIIIAYFKDRI